MPDTLTLSIPALSHLPALGTEASSVVKAGNGDSYAIFFEESSMDSFNAWKQALKEKGYTPFAESDFSGETEDTKNLFATYVNETHVIRVSYHSFNGRLCVVSELRNEVTEPFAPTATPYTAAGKDYPVAVATLGIADILKEEAGMCYMIRVSDGSFVIVDAMAPWGEDSATGRRMLGILKKLAPDPDHVVISAWFITHAHGDHHGGFLQFAEIAANDPTVELRAVGYNFAADEVLNTCDVNAQNSFLAAVAKFGPAVKHIKPHTGDVLHFADVKLEVLYSQVDHMAIESFFHNYNTTSLVLRAVMADGQKMLIGADHHVSGAIKDKEGNVYSMGCEGAMYNWYGSYSKSDIVTTFHHGYGGGGDHEVYARLDPKIILWDINWYRIELNRLNENRTNGAFWNNENIKTLISDDNVQVLTLSDGKIAIADYDTYEDFLADQPLA